jgi:hypothetical protein
MKALTLFLLLVLVPLISKADDGVKLKVCPYYPEPLPNERKVFDPPMEIGTQTPSPIQSVNTVTPKRDYKAVNVNVSIYVKLTVIKW